MRLRNTLFAGAALIAATLTASAVFADTTILNVSYDPTRELYKAYQRGLRRRLEGQDRRDRHHRAVARRLRRAGPRRHRRPRGRRRDAGARRRHRRHRQEAGKIAADWQKRLANNSAPYTSTIVFLVRKGNPKGIKDWDDLVKDGVQVITPNPKTSGGARWNYLAAWAYADQKFGGDEAKDQEFVSSLYRNVPVLDTGARGSTTTFAQRGIGDVLLAWENEAFLALKELGADKFEIVVPSLSIMAEPPVAVVDGNVDAKGTRKVAEAYLELSSTAPEPRRSSPRTSIARPSPKSADPKDLARFPDVKLVTIDDPLFGGWAKAQPKHFADGGIFDQIYKPKSTN